MGRIVEIGPIKVASVVVVSDELPQVRGGTPMPGPAVLQADDPCRAGHVPAQLSRKLMRQRTGRPDLRCCIESRRVYHGR